MDESRRKNKKSSAIRRLLILVGVVVLVEFIVITGVVLAHNCTPDNESDCMRTGGYVAALSLGGAGMGAAAAGIGTAMSSAASSAAGGAATAPTANGGPRTPSTSPGTAGAEVDTTPLPSEAYETAPDNRSRIAELLTHGQGTYVTGSPMAGFTGLTTAASAPFVPDLTGGGGSSRIAELLQQTRERADALRAGLGDSTETPPPEAGGATPTEGTEGGTTLEAEEVDRGEPALVAEDVPEGGDETPPQDTTTGEDDNRTPPGEEETTVPQRITVGDTVLERTVDADGHSVWTAVPAPITATDGTTTVTINRGIDGQPTGGTLDIDNTGTNRFVQQAHVEVGEEGVTSASASFQTDNVEGNVEFEDNRLDLGVYSTNTDRLFDEFTLSSGDQPFQSHLELSDNNFELTADYTVDDRFNLDAYSRDQRSVFGEAHVRLGGGQEASGSLTLRTGDSSNLNVMYDESGGLSAIHSSHDQALFPEIRIGGQNPGVITHADLGNFDLYADIGKDGYRGTLIHEPSGLGATYYNTESGGTGWTPQFEHQFRSGNLNVMGPGNIDNFGVQMDDIVPRGGDIDFGAAFTRQF